MVTELHHRGPNSLSGSLDHVWSWRWCAAGVGQPELSELSFFNFFFIFFFSFFILNGCDVPLRFWWVFVKLFGLGCVGWGFLFNPSSYSPWISWTFISSYQVKTSPYVFGIIHFKIKLKYMRLKYFSVFISKIYWVICQRSPSFSVWVLIHSVVSLATTVSNQLLCNELKCRSM